MSWTQPICNRCWPAFSAGAHQGRVIVPTRLREPEPETCAFCGAATRSGIYVRANPQMVPHPRAEVEA